MVRNSAGSAAITESPASRLEYTDAKTPPTTATPRVPPSSRVVSLTAEPTPALSADSEPMMASVAGAVVNRGRRRARPFASQSTRTTPGVRRGRPRQSNRKIDRPPPDNRGSTDLFDDAGAKGARDGYGHRQQSDTRFKCAVVLDELEILG